jgi:hypothetical protein
MATATAIITSICPSFWLVTPRGVIPSGRYLKFKSTPMTNVFLTMLDRFGVDGVSRLGDSSGKVEGI